MKFFALSFWLNIKKLAICRVFLLVLPVVLAMGGLFLQSDNEMVAITAGVYFDTENPFEYEIFQRLTSANVQFVAYNDVAMLLEDVRLGNIDCGYIFNSNIENARVGDFSEIITLVTSPRTIAAPIVSEIVAAAVLRVAAEDIARDELQIFFGASDEMDAFVAWQFEAYKAMDIFMTPIFEGVIGYEDAIPSLMELTARRVMRGMVGLAIQIFALFAVPVFIGDGQHSLRRALVVKGKLIAYDVSLWLAATIVMSAIGVVGLTAIWFFAPLLLGSFIVEVFSVAMLSAVCAAIIMLAGRFFKSADFIQNFGLFIVIANVIFGGVLIDLAEINMYLGYAQWVFPLFWYSSL